ncbi:hypothetical protein Daesc_000032 [Daldinia eschscholtzii]|uniref:2'-5' RNA ligase family protein n=1 Tax=Daldinia eschscholtzii TaxID=292717 RepID=A0AAX6MX61_9PEZI
MSQGPTMNHQATMVESPSSQSDMVTSNRRRKNHRPKINAPEGEETYYVLTLQTDTELHQAMCALRKRYYPPALLRVGAHVSLFRALPGSTLPSLRSDIASAAAPINPFGIQAVGPPTRLGRGGVAVPVLGLEPVESLVQELQRKWCEVLSRQDRGVFRGHYTLMNKVEDSEVVTRCLEELRREFRLEGCPGRALGLSLWRYDRGWWHHETDFPFLGAQ